MKKPLIKTSMNASEFPKNYEEITEPSLTIPDQTLTIREILDRYARGLSIDGVKNPLFDDEDFLPDPRTLDLEERYQLAQQFEQELSDMKKPLSTIVDNSVENSQIEESLNEES